MWFKSIVRTLLVVALFLAPAAGLVGCGGDDTSDKIDKAVKDAGDAVKDATE